MYRQVAAVVVTIAAALPSAALASAAPCDGRAAWIVAPSPCCHPPARDRDQTAVTRTCCCELRPAAPAPADSSPAVVDPRTPTPPPAAIAPAAVLPGIRPAIAPARRPARSRGPPATTLLSLHTALLR